MNTDELIISDKNNKEKLTTHLNQYGIAIIPNFIEKKIISSLCKEFERLISSEDNSFKKKSPYSVGDCVIVRRNKINTKEYPHTYAVFSDIWMRNVASTYLNAKVELKSEIFVVRDVIGSQHVANDLHFDRTRTFKFFLYLSDTNEENGAFSCVPGSHKYTAEVRKKTGKKISASNGELTRRVPEEISKNAIPICGEGGTLILFDTEIYHKAGNVTKGRRLVMRGHTRPKTTFFQKAIQSLYYK